MELKISSSSHHTRRDPNYQTSSSSMHSKGKEVLNADGSITYTTIEMDENGEDIEITHTIPAK